MAEVTGVVLGAAPLLAAALQQYGALYRICKRYKKCHSGMDALTQALDVQKAIFETQTRLLLLPIFGSDVTEALMADASDIFWQNRWTSSCIDSVLGSHRDAFMMAARTVHEKMQKMEDELSKINIPEKPTGRLSIRDWRKTVQSKIRYALSEARLASMATSVRDATTDYYTLRSQIQEAQRLVLDSKGPSPTDTNVDRIRTTHAAAERIYELLRVACRLRPNHQAHFGLTPDYKSSVGETEIRFHIAYDQQQPCLEENECGPLWFVVQSTLDKKALAATQAPIQSISTYESPRKDRNLSLATFLPTRSASTGDNTALTNTATTGTSTLTPPQGQLPPSTASTMPVLQDSDIAGSLCARLLDSSSNSSRTESCIGLIENSTEWNHLVYSSLGPLSSYHRVGDGNIAPNLATLLASFKAQNSLSNRFSIVQRLRFARTLSTAVLSFYATPWMQSCWTSRDVLVYNLQPPDAVSGGRLVPEAFIEVSVHTRDGSADLQKLTSPLPTSVRNPILYNLGVMLLELASEAPLREMHRDSSSQISPAISSDFDLALQKSKTVAMHMGTRYSNVVDRCLWCDFGQGADLDSPELQKAVHRSVIAEFEDMEAGFRKLGMV